MPTHRAANRIRRSFRRVMLRLIIACVHWYRRANAAGVTGAQVHQQAASWYALLCVTIGDAAFM